MVGTSLGGAAGIFFQNVIDPNISASTFALLGAAALLVSIQRSTVSHWYVMFKLFTCVLHTRVLFVVNI